jgi:predicted porin
LAPLKTNKQLFLHKSKKVVAKREKLVNIHPVCSLSYKPVIFWSTDMTKNILSLAVAAALTAGAGIAQAQDITIYGHMHYSTDYVTASKKGSWLTKDREDWQTGVNRNSRIGVKGSEDLGNGLKAIFQIESEVLASNNGAGGSVGDRNTYVGLSGDWGTVLMGRHDTPYKIATGSLDLFADTIADYNNNIGSVDGWARNAAFDTRAQQTLAYISPNMNGLTLAAAVVGITLDEGKGTGVRDSSAVSLAAMYANGPLFASLAYENYNGALSLAHKGDRRSSDAWKLGLGYKANDFTVGFVYEDIELGSTTKGAWVKSQQNWMLNASYAFGNNVLKAQYGYSDPKGRKNDYENFSIGLDHNLSKRTSLYALYSNMSNQSWAAGNLYCANAAFGDQCAPGARNIDAVSFGIQHKF